MGIFLKQSLNVSVNHKISIYAQILFQILYFSDFSL